MVKALVLRTAGTNCDGETVHALHLSGAKVQVLHLSELARNPDQLAEFSILVIPGGFSYGDDVAAGRILANELKFKMGGAVRDFVRRKKMVVGICNGFQVLVKAGLLPGLDVEDFRQTVTLAQNDSGRFQCEWVKMKKEKSRAHWLNRMPGAFELPIAHGEGKFMAMTSSLLKTIEKNAQVVFRYSGKNPNGSAQAIAACCNPDGNVVGMMPHPERFVTPYQHPNWTLNAKAASSAPGLIFWECAVNYARSLG